MKVTSKPAEILTKLNEMAGFSPDEEIDLFEVCLSLLIIFILFVLSCIIGDCFITVFRRSNLNLLSCANMLIRSSLSVLVRYVLDD